MLNNANYTIETEQETDGRWIAEISEIPGAMAYGETKEQARVSVEALVLRVIADEMEEKTSKNLGFTNISFSLS